MPQTTTYNTYRKIEYSDCSYAFPSDVITHQDGTYVSEDFWSESGYKFAAFKVNDNYGNEYTIGYDTSGFSSKKYPLLAEFGRLTEDWYITTNNQTVTWDTGQLYSDHITFTINKNLELKFYTKSVDNGIESDASVIFITTNSGENHIYTSKIEYIESINNKFKFTITVSEKGG